MRDSRPGATTPEQSDSPGAAAHVRPYLFLLLEFDRPLAGGARYTLDGIDQVTIGRGTARSALRGDAGGRRSLHLRLPSGFLSSSHVRIAREGPGWVLEDAGSRNGTWVNGVRAARETLHDGDFIEAGHVVLRFRTLPAAVAIDSSPAATSLAALPGFATLLPALEHQHDQLVRLARAPLPILLLGDTGTGKELLARAVHAASGRPGAIVALNCAALTGSLLESQLFGHVRGAFTGAARDEPGLVRASDGGTLFLDEIGDLNAPAQAALLRVLQEREVMPVGSTRVFKVDLRVIAATHRQLDLLATRGEFRNDLYARLAGHVHQLVPLRERKEDLGLIIASLLARIAPERSASLRLAPDAGRAVVSHGWPLNVRELEQALIRAVALAGDDVLRIEQLARPAAAPAAAGPAPGTDGGGEVDEAEREATLRQLLERHRGNVSEVARALGRTRMQIHRWMRRYGIDPARFRE